MNKYRANKSYFWKIAIIILGAISLSTGIVKSPGFWTSYVLDIAGPAWNYILIRGQYSLKNQTFLSRKFSPEFALILIVGICIIIETSQYFKLYEAHFDPYDFVAYVSGVLPIYVIDRWIIKRGESS